MADDIQSNIKINIDTTNAMDSIRLLQSQISAFHQQMSKMGAASVADSRNMQQNLINSINSTGQFAANITKIKTTAEQFSSSLEKNKLTMGEYFRYAGGASKTFGKLFKAEFETINKVARERVKDLQSQYIKLGRDANGAMQAIKVRPLTLDMQNLGTKTQIAAQKQQLLNQLLKQGSTNLLNFGKNTQWAGRQLMVGFTIPLSIMGGAAMKAYKEIEEASIRLKRVYGDFGTTAQETEKMVKQVQALALEYTKYGIAVKDSMEVAATAAATGKKGADLLAQVANANRLSALGGIEQQKALQTTISLTDAFSISAKDLSKNINFLNAVENQTVLSIDDLTTAIPKAAPVIQQLGGDVKDLAFFLTAMKEGGINASEGANAIKSGLASIINPTNTASKMLQGFGINLRAIVNDNKGDVKKTVVDFAKALDTLDPINRAKAIEQLFGKFQFARMSTLFKNVIEQGSQASEVLKLANQSSLELSMLAQRELGKIEASPLYKFQKALADFQAQLAPVGEQFMKAITPIINFGTDILKNFNGLGEGVKGFIVKFVAVAGVIGPVLLMSFGLIANAVANVIKGFALMKDIFNKTGKSSMSLGDQVSYMTNEQIQAAAIASSLDQVHSKLKQTFTSEAAAVDMLTAAYQRSVAAQSAFGVPITPRAPVGKGPVRKYATGGIISGPGTGTSDSILAMVSNGEAIIPAASVARNPGMVRQLVSGNIPGFEKGTEFAHIGERKRIGAQSLLGIISEDPSIVSKRTEQVVTGLAKVFGDKFLVNIYAKLGMRTGQTSDGVSINNLLGKQGVSKEEFLADFDKQGTQRWKDSLKYAGLKMKDVSEELAVLDTAIREEVVKLESGTIRDRDVKTAYDRAVQKVGKGGVVVPAFDTLSKTAGEARVNMSQTVAASAGLLPVAGGGSKGAIDIDGMKLRKGGDRFTFYSKRGFDIVGEAFTGVKDGMIRGIKTITRQRSPSKEAESAGANIGKGAIQGIKSQIDDAKNAGAQVGQAAAQGVSQSGRTSRRVSSEGNLIFIPGQGYVSEGQLARDTALASAPVQGPKEGNRFQRFRAGMNANSIYKGIQGADQEKLAGGIRNKAFGASGALAVGSMVAPGEMGQMMGVASMLTSFGGMGAGGIAKGLKSLSPNLIKVGLQFGKFVPYLGAAIIAFEAFDSFIMPLIKKNSKAYEAIADTLSVTQDKLDKINNFFGTELKLTGVRGTTIASGDQTKAQATIAQQFQQSQEFKDLYQESAKEMQKLTDAQFKRAMQAMATDLFGQGMEAEGVTAIIDAIAIEAKKTRVSIAPELFSIANPETKALMQKNLKTVFAQVAEGAKGVSPAGTLDPTGRTLEAATGAFDNTYLTPVDPESIAKIKAGTAEIASYMSALSGQFANGEISVKEFNIEYGKLISISNQQPGTSGIEAMRAAMISLNSEIGNAMRGLSDVQFGVWQKAITAGVTPTVEALDAATYATEAVKEAYTKNFADAEKQLMINRAKEQKLTKQVRGLQNSSVDIANTEQKINDKYDKRIAQIEKIKKLNDQIAQSQQGQLTLAEALNQGDIGAAARAAIDIQKNDVQNALDRQQTGLEDAKKAETGVLKNAQASNTAAIQKLTTEISDLNTNGVVVKNPEGATKPLAQSAQGNDFLGNVKYAGTIASLANVGTFLGGILPKLLSGNVKGIFESFMAPGTAVTQDGKIVPQRPVGKVTPYTGGHITGPGSGTSDSIPAMLSNGEYVIRANAVKTIGVNTLDKLNQADRMGFAAGGMVDKFKKKKPKPPKPKPYTLDDLRKPISEKDDPEWYDYSYNFLKQQPGSVGILRNYNWTAANSGWYDAKGPSAVRGQRDLIDYSGEKPEFTSVAGTIKYYKGLIASRRAGKSHIDAISQDRWWSGMGAPKAQVRRNNNIDNRTFGKYNGLDKVEARILANAMTRLFGKDKVKEGFKALGLSSELLTNKSMFKNMIDQQAWEKLRLNNTSYPTLSPNTPKYADGGEVKNWDLKDPSAPWNQGDYKKFNDYQTRKQYWAMAQPGSREIVEAGKTAGYFMPGIGSGLAFGDAGTSFGKGDVGGGLLNTAFGFGAMWIPKALGMIGKGLGAAGDFIKTGLGIRGGRNALKAAASSTGADVSKVGKLAPRLGFNLSDSALQSMIRDNFYGNMRTGIRSSTSDSLMNRIAVEKNMMGIPANAPASRTPAYGFLTTAEDVPSYYNSIMGGMGPRSIEQSSIDRFNLLVNSQSRYLQRYGSNTIKLKPKALGRATVSMGDSLSIWDQAIRLGKKIPRVDKLSSLSSTFPALSGRLGSTQKMMNTEVPGIKTPTSFPYIEAHLPGGFTLKDIESIMLNPSGRFSPQDKVKIAEDLAERRAALEALFESMGIKGIKITENEGIKIGKNALKDFMDKGGKMHEGTMANYPLPTRGPKKPTQTPFSPISGPMQGPGLPFGFSKAPTKAEMDAVVAFIQNSPLAQIQRGDALASIVSKSQIAKGTAMFRVPTIRQNEELATKKVGDIIELGKRFTSIAGQSELQAIGMTAAGKLNTGNRERPVNTIMKFIAGEDIPGILNHKVYNQNYLKNAFGKKADEYPFQSEGLLPPGLKGKIVGISQSGDQRILEVLISKFSKGGMVPKYYANGGYAMGTDTVPAMLTPGEFVIKKSAVDRIGTSTLSKINGYADGGLVGGTSTVAGDSVYNNTYEINVNVSSASNPNDIANAVMRQIRQIDNTRVRGLN